MTQGLVHVGIAGLGRSGWRNHALILKDLTGQFTICAVTDADANRCRQAAQELRCHAHTNLHALLADSTVELVVLATPSHLHCVQTLEALAAGKHVLCEKPMACASAEADQMIQAAHRAGRILTVFQNQRYMPGFLQVRRVIAGGKLGRIVQVRFCIHSFGRRWDWQTLKEFGGGELNNTTSHFLDQALQLIGPAEPEVFCHLERTLTSGDAEDHVKLILRSRSAPLVELEVTKACAYPQPLWHVMGTAGGLTGTATALTWKYVDFSTLPPRPVEKTPTSDRSYNAEELQWCEESWKMPPDLPSTQVHFYRDLYCALREGALLVVTPESVRRQIAILERCRQLCPVT